ncbi:MAG: adenosylcobinamide-GDP ribazoletransferase [Chloroflexi bacterium]|nr:adenosylcobinamide-GDP ribazoletransferase [Chloroflexota bacterium]
MKYLRLALGFLTVLPSGGSQPLAPGDLGRAAAWYPWVGLLLGGLVAAVHAALGQVFPPLLAAALTVAAWAGLTGGLHLDGLADCCDALPHPSSPSRRLEILKDSRLGSFGGIGLSLFLLLKIVALASLPSGKAVWAILLAAVCGRWLLLPAGRQPAARPGGLGADFALGLRTGHFGLAVVPTLILAGLAGGPGWLGLLLAHGTAAGVFALARNRLGGLTGDVFGLTVETGELAVLLAFCLRIPAIGG